MSYKIKKISAVIELTADVSGDLIGAEVVQGTPTVSIEPSGQLTAGAVNITGNIASADFSGGIAGDSYLIIFKFTTDASRQYDLCQTMKVI